MKILKKFKKENKRKIKLSFRKNLFVYFIAGTLFLFFLIFIADGALKPPPFVYTAPEKKFLKNDPESPGIAFHIKTPKVVKGIYLTSWVAGMKNWRERLVKMVEKTELNTIVIDVKDYSGRVSFAVSDPVLEKSGSSQIRIADISSFIQELHKKNIYVIGRISVFQDPYLTKKRPDLAVKRKNGKIWKDYKGLSWLDPCSKEVWDYIVRIANEAGRVGFDELNFDYVRFPSDGNMKDIVYTFCSSDKTLSDSIEDFFKYLSQRLKPLGLPLSVDLFGLTTWNNDDLNIGQILERAAPYFDYIAPMVYPSHYPKGFMGFSNPAKHPYKIINSCLKKASQRLKAASSTPLKLRPWLQDFNLGANYNAYMVRREKQAVYDAGLTSWMLWDPSSRYTWQALEK